MKREFNIEVTLDTESARVTALAINEGIYDRSEFLAEGIDKPIIVNRAAYLIAEFLDDKAEKKRPLFGAAR